MSVQQPTRPINAHPGHLDTGRGGRVLLVDGGAAPESPLARWFAEDGMEVDLCCDQQSTIRSVAQLSPDVVVIETGPLIENVELCRSIRRNSSARLTPILFMGCPCAPISRIEVFDAGATQWLVTPVDRDELLAQVRALVRMKRYTDDLDPPVAIITALTAMIETRDGYTEGHCHRMANYATALGRELNLSDQAIKTLYHGGFLHDIGMLAIPDHVLSTPGPLATMHYELVKSHTTIGESLLQNLRALRPVCPIVRSHHERLDGSGYPDGLRGDGIPLLAQIISVVDIYEAVTTRRPYQEARSSERAIDVLREEVERGWRRRDLVETFISVIESGRFEAFRA